MNNSDLLSQIEQVEEEIREKQKTLLDLQHEYLSSRGWIIIPFEYSEILPHGFTYSYEFFCGIEFTYSKDDEIFLDIDHAMEYEDEQ